MTSAAPWHARLAAAIGLAEKPGPGSTPRILDMARTVAAAHPRLDWIGAYYEDDDIPWCGLAVAWAVVEAGLMPPLPNPLAARSWGTWGRRLERPVPGAVLVFTRDGGGHVGLFEGEDATHYHVLGGNQGNRVSRAAIAKSRLLVDDAGRPTGIRWPDGVALVADAAPAAGPAGLAVSTQEA
jgi:uncharacterized protein (TIGR02594 family)